MRKVLPVLLALLAAGCVTPAERAAQIEREVDEMIVIYGPACEKLGFRTDTDPWRDCILRLNAKDSYRSRPATTTCFGHRGFYHCSSN